jgi:outer membrane protein OmpA-like peptidoglycan-associated protein
VASYLTDRGVARNRLSAEGRGQNQPVADNATEAGRAQNRRVEIYLKPIQG